MEDSEKACAYKYRVPDRWTCNSPENVNETSCCAPQNQVGGCEDGMEMTNTIIGLLSCIGDKKYQNFSLLGDTDNPVPECRNYRSTLDSTTIQYENDWLRQIYLYWRIASSTPQKVYFWVRTISQSRALDEYARQLRIKPNAFEYCKTSDSKCLLPAKMNTLKCFVAPWKKLFNLMIQNHDIFLGSQPQKYGRTYKKCADPFYWENGNQDAKTYFTEHAWKTCDPRPMTADMKCINANPANNINHRYFTGYYCFTRDGSKTLDPNIDTVYDHDEGEKLLAMADMDIINRWKEQRYQCPRESFLPKCPDTYPHLCSLHDRYYCSSSSTCDHNAKKCFCNDLKCGRPLENPIPHEWVGPDWYNDFDNEDASRIPDDWDEFKFVGWELCPWPPMYKCKDLPQPHSDDHFSCALYDKYPEFCHTCTDPPCEAAQWEFAKLNCCVCGGGRMEKVEDGFQYLDTFHSRVLKSVKNQSETDYKCFPRAPRRINDFKEEIVDVSGLNKGDGLSLDAFVENSPEDECLAKCVAYQISLKPMVEGCCTYDNANSTCHFYPRSTALSESTDKTATLLGLAPSFQQNKKCYDGSASEISGKPLIEEVFCNVPDTLRCWSECEGFARALFSNDVWTDVQGMHQSTITRKGCCTFFNDGTKNKKCGSGSGSYCSFTSYAGQPDYKDSESNSAVIFEATCEGTEEGTCAKMCAPQFRRDIRSWNKENLEKFLAKWRQLEKNDEDFAHYLRSRSDLEQQDEAFLPLLRTYLILIESKLGMSLPWWNIERSESYEYFNKDAFEKQQNYTEKIWEKLGDLGIAASEFPDLESIVPNAFDNADGRDLNEMKDYLKQISENFRKAIGDESSKSFHGFNPVYILIDAWIDRTWGTWQDTGVRLYEGDIELNLTFDTGNVELNVSNVLNLYKINYREIIDDVNDATPSCMSIQYMPYRESEKKMNVTPEVQPSDLVLRTPEVQPSDLVLNVTPEVQPSDLVRVQESEDFHVVDFFDTDNTCVYTFRGLSGPLIWKKVFGKMTFYSVVCDTISIDPNGCVFPYPDTK